MMTATFEKKGAMSAAVIPAAVGRAVSFGNTGEAPLAVALRPPRGRQIHAGPLLVGLVGECVNEQNEYAGSARSGKDTVAQHLIETFGRESQIRPRLDVRRYALADALKVEVYQWLQGLRVAESVGVATLEPWISFDDLPPASNLHVTVDEARAWFERRKNTYRRLLQHWGSEYRRGADENYWVRKLLEQVERERPQIALIPDVRFRNETRVAHVTVKVVRTGYTEVDRQVGAHVSESELRGFVPDFTISAKSGDVDGLKRQAEEMFVQILEKFRVH